MEVIIAIGGAFMYAQKPLLKNIFYFFCESTVDMPYSYMKERNIPIIFYSYTVDGKRYDDDMFMAAGELREKYPDRKIIIIDSLCSSSGYGLLVDYAADLRDMGMSLEEIYNWTISHRQNIHHQFFSHRLDFFRRSGRMSGPAATLGTVLNICPIMRLDDLGRIIAYDKARGRKKAIERTVSIMECHAENGKEYSGKCHIYHSRCQEEANMVKDAIALHFPNISDTIRIFDIGPIIASPCGPGTVAVFFLGDQRQPQ